MCQQQHSGYCIFVWRHMLAEMYGEHRRDVWEDCQHRQIISSVCVCMYLCTCVSVDVCVCVCYIYHMTGAFSRWFQIWFQPTYAMLNCNGNVQWHCLAVIAVHDMWIEGRRLASGESIAYLEFRFSIYIGKLLTECEWKLSQIMICVWSAVFCFLATGGFYNIYRMCTVIMGIVDGGAL